MGYSNSISGGFCLVIAVMLLVEGLSRRHGVKKKRSCIQIPLLVMSAVVERATVGAVG